MRIAFFGARLSRRADGVRVVVEELSRALADRGHEVRVFGIADQAWIDGDCEKWRGPPTEMFRSSAPRAFGIMRGALDRLVGFAPEVVHVHGLWMYSSYVASLWASHYPGALVVSPHGMLSPVALSYSRFKKLVAARLFQKRCLTHADMLHATSKTEARDIRDYGVDTPVCVFPLGVRDLVGPSDWEAVRHNEIVTLGRLHHKKGLDILLKAWSHIEGLMPNWSLKIAGPDDGGYEQKLKVLAADLKVSRVNFVPALYGEAKWRFLSEASVFILPTRSENFALTVPEALLCSTPVISTRGAPWSGLEDNGCGWWVDVNEYALAEAMRFAISIGNYRRSSMGRAGRAWVLREFSWKVMAERAEACYRAALEQHA